MPPNVLLVIFDAARRDALEPYGAAPGSSPTTAQLASRGAALPDVYATGCWTVPSHSSMFTGLLPRAAGLSKVPSVPAAKPIVESHRDRTLAEVMRRKGYATGSASANVWLSDVGGFDTGFDELRVIDSGRHAALDRTGRRERLRWAREAVAGKVDDGAQAVAETIEEWLRRPRSEPFFWYVNLLECHSPYLPPRPYGGRSPVRRLLASEDARRYYTLARIWAACTGVIEVPEATLERARRLYAGAIRYMDDWLARVFERMSEAGVLDDTVVIVASDHGENFGEGGYIAHANSLDNRLLRVPFVVAGPDVGGAAELNSLADLPRFVAERVGLEDHPWTDGPPAGYGVAQFDPPVGPDDADGIRRLEEIGLGEGVERFTTSLTCAVRGDRKLLRRGDREEIYDLAADPLELAPLAAGEAPPDQAEEIAALRAAIEHPSVATVSGGGDAAPSQAPAASEEELRALEERMKLLGYM